MDNYGYANNMVKQINIKHDKYTLWYNASWTTFDGCQHHNTFGISDLKSETSLKCIFKIRSMLHARHILAIEYIPKDKELYSRT